MDFFQTSTKPYELKESRQNLSLISQIYAIFGGLMTFFFYAFDCFKRTYMANTPQGIRQITDLYNGYNALNVTSFKGYLFFFLILSMVLSFLIAVFFLFQIFNVSEMHGPNMVLLGLKVLCEEFMFSYFNVGGFLLLAFSFVNFLQYYIFLGKHKDVDHFIFGGLCLMLVALLPSAIAVSKMFLQS
jgi:hypothetical protein